MTLRLMFGHSIYYICSQSTGQKNSMAKPEGHVEGEQSSQGKRR